MQVTHLEAGLWITRDTRTAQNGGGGGTVEGNRRRPRASRVKLGIGCEAPLKRAGIRRTQTLNGVVTIIINAAADGRRARAIQRLPWENAEAAVLGGNIEPQRAVQIKSPGPVRLRFHQRLRVGIRRLNQPRGRAQTNQRGQKKRRVQALVFHNRHSCTLSVRRIVFTASPE